MKEKTKLIIIICSIICVTLLLGEFIYLKYNNKNVTNKAADSNVKKEEITLKEKEKSSYFNDSAETNNNEENADSDDVVSYVDIVVDQAIDDAAKEENESKLKNTFIVLTDFIFYEGTIKGYTFKELRDEQKQKIMTAWEKLDAKIEAKYPNYKEKIKDKKDKTYSNVKEKFTSLKEIIKEKIGEDATEEAKTDTENLKDVTSYYKDKTSEYYNKAKDKASDWYNNYKNSDK